MNHAYGRPENPGGRPENNGCGTDAALPDTAVEKALAEMPDASGRLILVAAGKAAWQMAAAAYRILGERIDDGIVITKHGHAMGAIGNLTIREAGHPVPDADSYNATEAALTMTAGLKVTDTVLFLLSGGGSALFEKPDPAGGNG